MEYNIHDIRRQDRLLPYEEAVLLLRTGEYGVLSMIDNKADQKMAYGVPVSFAWDGKESLYIHCAPEGRKLRCLGKNTNVSFCVTGKTKVIPDKFTTAYQSIILECHAETGLPEDERRKALRLILEKYSPDHVETGMKYAERSFGRTEVIKLTTIKWSGKCKRII